ncbi:tail fiber domain-containing protein [Hymenobacter cellulosilyticus]|uniref:Tail fiber domain-containing protein n=1 Tax=Hymenobacter cellulosilyticus TaxID=2932248 RepID=A0A8T9Q6S8_9BACT|nr:tail fiber domain-containing protein [Hymenobacter cellulosilyticus]UOQ71470.1 tail fiber domain-containing protein [Hymenobacter cellulosilyticus]
MVGDVNAMTFGSTAVTSWNFGRSNNGGAGIALRVGVGATNGNGAYLTAGGVWTNTSDINLKENIQPVESSQVLGLIRQLPLSRWTYKGTAGETHLGPIAQDFYRLFHLGLNETSISTIDPAGVALAGVQELAHQNDQLRAENAQLRQQLQAVQAGQTTLDARLATLERTAQLAMPVAKASR